MDHVSKEIIALFFYFFFRQVVPNTASSDNFLIFDLETREEGVFTVFRFSTFLTKLINGFTEFHTQFVHRF